LSIRDKEATSLRANKRSTIMKVDLFVNASFPEKDGSTTITARLRNNSNAKSFRLPNAPGNLQKNDGIAVELSGKLAVGEKYVTPESFKVIDHKPGAYIPAAVEMNTDEYLASLEEVPYHDDTDAPSPF
jgi:hypothetical protein